MSNISQFVEQSVLGLTSSNTETCWRVNEGKQLCPGQGTFSTQWITAPLVLSIRLDPSSVVEYNHTTSGSLEWNVAQVITVSSAGVNLTYTLGAMVFYSRKMKHFCTVYQIDDQFFHYDGMHKNLPARRLDIAHMQDAQKSLGGLWGATGYFYRLDGGSPLQGQFLDASVHQLHENLNIAVDCDWTDGFTCHIDDPDYVVNPEAWKRYRKEKDGQWREYDPRRKPLPRPSAHPPGWIALHNRFLWQMEKSNHKDWHVRCKCGIHGVASNRPLELYIRCCMCQTYSHIACIRRGVDEKILKQPEQFECSGCSFSKEPPSKRPEPPILDYPVLL